MHYTVIPVMPTPSKSPYLRRFDAHPTPEQSAASVCWPPSRRFPASSVRTSLPRKQRAMPMPYRCPSPETKTTFVSITRMLRQNLRKCLRNDRPNKSCKASRFQDALHDSNDGIVLILLISVLSASLQNAANRLSPLPSTATPSTSTSHPGRHTAASTIIRGTPASGPAANTPSTATASLGSRR